MGLLGIVTGGRRALNGGGGVRDCDKVPLDLGVKYFTVILLHILNPARGSSDLSFNLRLYNRGGVER